MPTINDLPVEVVHMIVEKLYHSILNDALRDVGAIKSIHEFYVIVSEEAFVLQKAVRNSISQTSRVCTADGGPFEKLQSFRNYRKLSNCEIKLEAIVGQESLRSPGYDLNQRD